MNSQEIVKLKVGQVVKAIKHLDEYGANVEVGQVGKVIHRADYYGDGAGPLVRWDSSRTCNVYKGDVLLVR